VQSNAGWQAGPRRRQRHRLLASFQRRPAGWLAGAVLAIVVFCGVFSPLVATQDPTSQTIVDALKPPGYQGSNGTLYLLGTDNLGRDVWSRLVYGARISLSVGVAAVTIGTLGGLLLGLVSGYRAGWLDMVAQRIMDGMQAIPTLILALVLVAALGKSLVVTAIAIGITQIPRANRIIRSSVISVVPEHYIEAAVAVGASERRILFRHILPNVAGPTLIVFSTSIGAAIITEATLSFLGLAAPPPLATWGSMLAIEGRQYMLGAPWLLIAPAAALSLTVLAFNFLGDSVRDALDPRQQRG
jgi:peptide/nickel transport system permease protein